MDEDLLALRKRREQLKNSSTSTSHHSESEDDESDDDSNSNQTNNNNPVRLTQDYNSHQKFLKEAVAGDLNSEKTKDPFANYTAAKITDRESDYNKRRFNRSLPQEKGKWNYRDAMNSTTKEREDLVKQREDQKEKKEKQEKIKEQQKERTKQIEEQEKQRKKLIKSDKKSKKRGFESSSETETQKNGIELKYIESLDLEVPDQRYIFYTIKGGVFIGEIHDLHLNKVNRIGRDDKVNNIVTLHESCSGQHAIIVFKKQTKRLKVENNKKNDNNNNNNEIRPILIDLGSTNGTTLNRKEVVNYQEVELKEGDVLCFGESTRSYVLQVEKPS